MNEKRKRVEPGYQNRGGLAIGTRVRVTFPGGKRPPLDTTTRSEVFYVPPVVQVADHHECVPMAWVSVLPTTEG